MNYKTVEEIKNEREHDFISLLSLVKILRSENGCPWDKIQTHKSIRKCLIEETYEVVEGIDNDDPELLKEELGDLLFQVVFHSQIEEENGNYSMNDIIQKVCDKMVFRHPHIFSDLNVQNADQVSSNWDDIKLKENGQRNMASAIKKVPPSLPALMKAQKVQSKCRRKLNVGFLCREDALNFAKNCIERGDKDSVSKAIFALSSVADFDNTDIEYALNMEIEKFLSNIE